MKEKEIRTNGIVGLQQVPGSGEWLWGSDYTHGDLFEAEELFRMGHRIKKNRLILVHTGSGDVLEPVPAKEGQYFGAPYACDGDVMILYVDFTEKEIRVSRYAPHEHKNAIIYRHSLTEVKNCYNLMLHGYPLMLTRQAENRFQILWLETVDFPIDPQETFCCRNENLLYFSKWFEDPDYREEVVIRDLETGKILEQRAGSFYDTVGNEIWILC